MKDPYFWAEKSLKLFSGKVWDNLPPLWMISGVRVKKTPSIS